jgi:acyl-CoA synthetase (AMP-forming)/AMP-acid ligase II/thioesterase domain-containing protein/acyl carrier protein
MSKCQEAPLTIRDLLFSRGQPDSSCAILGVDGEGITYRQLRGLVSGVAGHLAQLGHNNSDRIALALPNGTMLATAILAVSASHPCALLNPGMRENEFRLHLNKLKVKAIVVEAGADSPVREVAADMRVRLLEAHKSGPSGIFSLGGEAHPVGQPVYADEGDDAFLLQTSGTTAVPKLVPLTQSNICHTAFFVGRAMGLGGADRCLNVMPLFHGLGLVSLLSTLLNGGSIVCAHGFDPEQFFGWLERLGPTWYTAVPPVHQTILDLAPSNRGAISRSRLRFIRSAASALQPKLMLGLEECFGVPVLEAYGMTEAFIIGSNPPPPGRRKPGSVGIASGPEVTIMDGSGAFARGGAVGEIVVRGSNVMRGYEGDPEENAKTFVNGWLRTGDLGHIDGEGYIFIDGRVKEIINRGGEKVTPNEVDSTLEGHPAVKEAATFAMSHASLGEDVAAAVVLRRAGAATEEELRRFATERLARHKVPSRIFFVEALPKGPSGKILRRRLPEILRLGAPAEARRRGAAAASPPEAGGGILGEVIRIWESEMGVKGIGPEDNFFHLGGYSLMAARIFGRIEERLGVRLPLAAIYGKPTVAALAAEVGRVVSGAAGLLVSLRAGGRRPRLFMVHPVGGEVVNYRELAEALGEDQPVYAFRAAGLYEGGPLPATIGEMAGSYIREMKVLQPKGPYHLAGWCAGSVIAFEMAQQLRRGGDEVGLLAVLDFEAPDPSYWGSRRAARGAFLREGLYLGADLLKYAKRRRLGESLGMAQRAVSLERTGMRAAGIVPGDEVMLHGEFAPLPEEWKAVILNTQRALRSYRPSVYGGVITVFKRKLLPLVTSPDPTDGWGRYAGGGIAVVPAGGRMHYAVVRSPWVKGIAEGIRRRMDWHEGRRGSLKSGSG